MALLELDCCPTVRHLPAGDGPSLNVLGVQVTAKTFPRERGDRSFVFEAVVPPGAMVPLHTHAQWESFYVLDGEVQFGRTVDGISEAFVARPGDLVVIPCDAPHSFHNASDRAARLLVIGEAGLEPFFYAAGTVGSDGPPTPEQIGQVVSIMAEHGQTVVGAHPELPAKH